MAYKISRGCFAFSYQGGLQFGSREHGASSVFLKITLAAVCGYFTQAILVVVAGVGQPQLEEGAQVSTTEPLVRTQGTGDSPRPEGSWCVNALDVEMKSKSHFPFLSVKH